MTRTPATEPSGLQTFLGSLAHFFAASLNQLESRERSAAQTARLQEFESSLQTAMLQVERAHGERLRSEGARASAQASLEAETRRRDDLKSRISKLSAEIIVLEQVASTSSIVHKTTKKHVQDSQEHLSSTLAEKAQLDSQLASERSRIEQLRHSFEQHRRNYAERESHACALSPNFMKTMRGSTKVSVLFYLPRKGSS